MGGKKIETQPHLLVVDDEPDIREMIARHFRYLGFQVSTASNGKEALSLMSKMKTDIVISDIMMPVMNGVELLSVIRKEHPLIRVIMITGYVTLENAITCMRYGAETCVFKPLEDMSKLEAWVTEAVRKLNHWNAIFKELADAGNKQDSEN